MTKPRRKKKSIKLKVKRAVKFIQKNDKTRVHINSGDTIPNVEGRPPANNAATFKVKIRKK